MTKASIYGIKNCDTMKKAFKWLEANDIAYDFHDYKKQAPNKDLISQAIAANGWENVINRRGTTWRKLPQDIQASMNDKEAIKIALENPSIIKRPLLVYDEVKHLGFKEDEYKKIFID